MTEEENKPQREPRWVTNEKKALIKIPQNASVFWAPKDDAFFRVIPPNDLSLDRFMKLEEAMEEFLFVKNWEDIIQDVNKIYELSADGVKHADIRVLAFNLLYSMRNSKARRSFALKLCSVFIINEDDDEELYNNTDADKNIKIWKRNFHNDFFLESATNICGGHKTFAAHILRAYLGKEVMEHYLSQRENILTELINLGQAKGV
jgi:hypothetical protein